jgi:2-oxoisovalerate dehydrogenase E2 component (dihydrolipoyl transacylase)
MTIMPDFLLPDLGEGLEEAEVIAWRVRVGDQVVVDQVVVDVETAKAVVELPIPFAGTVAALHAESGTTVTVGAPLISVAAAAQTRPVGLQEAVGLQEPGVTLAPAAQEASGNVLVGYGTSPSPRRARSGRRRPGLVPPPAQPEPPAQAAETVKTAPTAEAPTVEAPTVEAAPVEAAPAAETVPAGKAAPTRIGPVPVSSPLVRKIARDAGLDLAGIRGTGPDGLVLRRDVTAALDEFAASITPGAAALPPAPAVSATSATPAVAAGEVRIPLRGVRKAAADKLARSRREIPEATVWVDVDATDLLAARAALNAREPENPVSLLALVARFAVAGLRKYPELNGHIDQDEIVLPPYVHLGFAAQTERGLVVPVVRDAQLLSTRELAAALGQRTEAARSGRLAPADLTGGTFTVNNYGVFGVDGSAAIINYPEVAILGMGRIIDRPWVVDGQVIARKVMELTLAFDHRVCDGGTAGGYLRYVADCIESPVLALGDL